MPEQSFEKLKNLIKDIEYCMLSSTTKDDRGNAYIHSRPMKTLWDEDGLRNQRLYFFTSKNCAKTRELGNNGQCNLSFSDASNHTYVSVSGTASFMENDRELIKRLWNPFFDMYFKGIDDPNLCIMVIDIHHCEYWDSSQGNMMAIITTYIKDALGIKEPIQTENVKLTV
ncbi:hypothetical protein ABK040_016726 [Willaertia magna]